MSICRFCGKDCDGEYHTDYYNAVVRQLPLEQHLGISDTPSPFKRTLLKTALAVVAGLGIYGAGKGVRYSACNRNDCFSTTFS